MKVEQQCFTPFVFSANGSIACLQEVVRGISWIDGNKTKARKYCITMSCLQRKTSFSLIRSIMLCMRGSSENLNQELKRMLQMTLKWAIIANYLVKESLPID